MTDKINHTIIIPTECASLRLDQALAKLLPSYSRTQLQAWIADGLVLVNGVAAKAKYKVKGDDVVLISATLKAQPEWEPQLIPLTIVYEDNDVLVINKPAGLVVHPGAGNRDQTLLNALLHHDNALKTLPRAGILHRLDKNTSGLLIIAKNAHALKALSHQLKKRQILREYLAVVQGKIISGGTIDAPIDRHPLKRQRMAVVETGKHAITHYRIAEKFALHTLLTVRLETGRTHQIRVHMAYIHHCIVGDPTYHERSQHTKGLPQTVLEALRQFKRQALHAYRLGIHHPVTQQYMEWCVDLPEDMQALIAVLKNEKK